ncbi:MAG TPA: YezD family protein [Lacunisphaera sp.]
MSESLTNSDHTAQPEWLRVVQQKVESLRYGVVQLVVHDGRVTQIERTEKTRLPSTRDAAAE